MSKKQFSTCRKRWQVGILCGFWMVLMAGCTTSSEGVFKAGTYQATVTGYNGEMVIEVAFDADQMLSVSVVEHDETIGIGDRPIKQLPEKMVAAQTYEVEAVTAATITSDAIIAGVKDCMEQAKNK